MRAATRVKVLWTVWMCGGGLATAFVTYVVTASAGWALVGLLASGPVLNLLGQSVVQPAKAIMEAPTAVEVGHSGDEVTWHDVGAGDEG